MITDNECGSPIEVFSACTAGIRDIGERQTQDRRSVVVPDSRPADAPLRRSFRLGQLVARAENRFPRIARQRRAGLATRSCLFLSARRLLDRRARRLDHHMRVRSTHAEGANPGNPLLDSTASR